MEAVARGTVTVETLGPDGGVTSRRKLRDVAVRFHPRLRGGGPMALVVEVDPRCCGGGSGSSSDAPRTLTLPLTHGHTLHVAALSSGSVSVRTRAPPLLFMLSGASPPALRLLVTCMRESRLATRAEMDAARAAGEEEARRARRGSASAAYGAESLLAGRTLGRTQPDSERRSEVVARGVGGGDDAGAPACRRAAQSLTAEQEAVVGAVLAGQSVFFTGSAGTGKSLLLHHLKAVLPPATTAFTASTGIAATAIGGTTLHAWAGLGGGVLAALDAGGPGALDAALDALRRRRDAVARWRGTRTLLIDEVSMVDAALLDALDALGRRIRGAPGVPFGGIQVVLSGDFFQLPPVGGGGGGGGSGGGGGAWAAAAPAKKFAFQAAVWPRALHLCVMLTRVFRQADADFVDLLNEVRWGRVGEASAAALAARWAAPLDLPGGLIPTKLHTHRANVDVENAAALAALPGEAVVHRAVDTHSGGSSGSGGGPGAGGGSERDPAAALDAACPAPRVLTLKEGAQVILTKTLDAASGLVNGARGVVRSFAGASRHPLVRFACGVEVVVRPETWTLAPGGMPVAARRQLPLDLAWALSIHKSQGMTLDAVEVSLSRVFECGQAYVALSRARSLAGLVLADRFTPGCVRAHPDVVAFYTALAAGSMAGAGAAVGDAVGARGGAVAVEAEKSAPPSRRASGASASQCSAIVAANAAADRSWMSVNSNSSSAPGSKTARTATITAMPPPPPVAAPMHAAAAPAPAPSPARGVALRALSPAPLRRGMGLGTFFAIGRRQVAAAAAASTRAVAAQPPPAPPPANSGNGATAVRRSRSDVCLSPCRQQRDAPASPRSITRHPASPSSYSRYPAASPCFAHIISSPSSPVKARTPAAAAAAAAPYPRRSAITPLGLRAAPPAQESGDLRSPPVKKSAASRGSGGNADRRAGLRAGCGGPQGVASALHFEDALGEGEDAAGRGAWGSSAAGQAAAGAVPN